MNSRIYFFHFLLCFALIFTIACFEPDKENSVTTELLKPVEVLIQGNVIDASTGSSLENISIKINRVLSNDTQEILTDSAGVELSALTDQSGSFVFSGRIALDVNSYEHYLYISDLDDEYFINDTNIIYSIKDATLNYADVRLVSKNPITTTNITGIIVDVIDDSAVADVALTLTHKTDSSIVHETASAAATGAFLFESVIVSEYTLDIDGSSLSTAYVRETSDLVLEGGDANALGNIRIAQELTNSDDLRVVLTWDQSAALDLDIQYTFPKEDFDFNHLGVQNIQIDGSDFSINPAYGFAEGLAYWPSSMGGNDSGRHSKYQSVEDEDLSYTYATNVNVSDTILNVPVKPGSITIYYIDSTDAIFYICEDIDNGDGTGTFTGNNIDYSKTRTIDYSTGVITVSLNGDLYDGISDTAAMDYEYIDEDYLSSPITVGANTIVERGRTSADGSAPEVLTIYKRNFMSSYPQNLTYYYDYGLKDYYPAGIGVFSIYCPSASTDSSKSIYDSGAEVKVYQGNTFLGKFLISDIGMGSLESNRKYWNVLLVEMGYTQTSPAATSEIYFRVAPYGSLAQQPEEVDDLSFLYNVPGLPRNVTYTAYYDNKPYYVATNMEKMIRLISTNTGIIYPMSNSTIAGVGTKDYQWRTGFTSWSEYFSGLGVGVNTIIGVPGASSTDFFIGLDQCLPDPTDYGLWAVASGGENSSPIVNGALPPADWTSVTMGSAADIRIYDSAIYMDPSSMKKGIVATSSGPKTISDGPQLNDWGILTSTVWFVCPLLNMYGDLTKDNEIFVSGEDNLWRLIRTASDDTYNEVNLGGSSLGGIVAMTPFTYEMTTAAIIAYRVVEGADDEYYFCVNDSGSDTAEAAVLNSWDKTIKINDLTMFKIGVDNFLFIATDQGVYYRRANSRGDEWNTSITSSPPRELSAMLRNVEVIKIVNYDGYIGLLTSGNGFIYAPYPDISGF